MAYGCLINACSLTYDEYVRLVVERAILSLKILFCCTALGPLEGIMLLKLWCNYKLISKAHNQSLHILNIILFIYII